MLRLYTIMICLCFVKGVFSQEFKVELGENKVGLNESFEISFVLNDSGKDFSPPPFSDFQILRGPSKSSSTSIINGDMSQELTYTYVLKPKKIGVFTILPASIKVKGKTIGTRPITIQVQKGSVSKKTNSPYNIVSRKVHLMVTSNKSSCYVGEPIVLTYTLYFNLNVGNVSQQPIKYNGFWVNNIEVNSSTKKTKYKGENYNSAVIKQVVLVPQKTGKQSIEKLSLDLVANVPTNKRDFFNMPVSQKVDYTAISNSLSINVLDLPSVGMPEDFSGAIGDFTLRVDLDRDSIGINESAIFSVTVSGSGNLTLINTPEVDFNDEIEVFDPKNLDNIKIDYRGVKGYKKEEYLIVPRYKGIYNLNPLEFNFFNPKTKKYVSLRSDIKTIEVSGSQKKENSYTLESISKEKVDLINEDIKFIKTTYGSKYIHSNFSKSNLFYVLICVGLFAFLIAFLYKKNQVDFNLFFRKNTLKQVLDKFKSINLLLNDKKYEEFQSELLNVLFFYISNSFSIKKGNLSIDKIKNVLLQKNIPNELVNEYIQLIKYLERCKYSPHQEDTVNKEIYIRSVTVVNKIDVLI